MRISGKILSTLAAGLVVVSTAGPAAAQTRILNDAKRNCIIGETAAGFLDVVPGKTADTRMLRQVDRENDKRQIRYENRADRDGETPEYWGRYTANLLRGRQPRGACFQLANGEWTGVRP